MDLWPNKSIISFVTTTTGLDEFLDATSTMAQRSDAHLEVCCLAVDSAQPTGLFAGAPTVVFQETLEQLQTQAEMFARQSARKAERVAHSLEHRRCRRASGRDRVLCRAEIAVLGPCVAALPLWCRARTTR